MQDKRRLRGGGAGKGATDGRRFGENMSCADLRVFTCVSELTAPFYSLISLPFFESLPSC